jgi:hypothetical protein
MKVIEDAARRDGQHLASLHDRTALLREAVTRTGSQGESLSCPVSMLMIVSVFTRGSAVAASLLSPSR